MKYVCSWFLGALVLAVIPLGFGDHAFVNYGIAVALLTGTVMVWAVRDSKKIERTK
jgi:MFS-type transporter involved in bile tolerance (Atg22 family)